jgi:hypothetical protein
MTAVACILNPLAPSEILVFANDSNGNLIFDTQQVTNGKDINIASKSEGEKLGTLIRNPSQLTAFIYNNLV